MMLWFRRWAPVLSLAAVSALALPNEQAGGRHRVPEEEQDVTLPSGKSQRDEILKAEREQNLKDAAQLVEMAEQLKADLEKNDRFVLSMATIKKTDDIEKLVKKIRSRLRH